MMKMRRNISLFLAIILIVLFFCGNGKYGVSASTPMPAFTVVSEIATAGDEVTVAVELSGNPGIHSATLELDYADELELVKVEDAELLGGFLSDANYDEKPLVLAWEDSLADTSNTTNGAVVYLTFRVEDDVPEGEYEVNLQVCEVYRIEYTEGQLELVDVEFQAVSGKVMVMSELRGDMNRDGLMTDADAIYLLYYTFFPDDYPLYQDGDYNNDGLVTDADAIYLLYHTFFPADYPL